MAENIILENEYLKMFSNSEGVHIETYKKGFPLEQIPPLLSQHPEIAVTSLNALRTAIMQAPAKPEKFGELKERITISFSDNEITAAVVFNITQEELDVSVREKLIKEIAACLNEKGIVYGIKKDLLTGELIAGKPYLIAEGTRPVNGNDAVVTMYELQEVHPEVKDDGRVDFYELKLINRVQAGDWLGERIEATEGIPGKSVKGTVIKAQTGKTAKLSYDKNTVMEIVNLDKTTLVARINGAVNYDNGKIKISNHLEIDGDVGISTGNIKFDGYVTIKGTVCNGFSVEATKDIEINSPLGLGSIKGLESTGGSIFVKGGISSRERTEIKARKSVYIKFVDNTVITCGNSAHIGYYSLNSEVRAKEVILDASNGKIIGGNIRAEIRVSAPVIGTEAERKTIVEVTGFNRQEVLANIDSVYSSIAKLKIEQQKLKQAVAMFDPAAQNDPFRRKEYNDLGDRLLEIRDEIRNLEEERKNSMGYLKTHGEGEVSVSKRIYPNSTIIIKGTAIEIKTEMLAATFFVQDGELKQI